MTSMGSVGQLRVLRPVATHTESSRSRSGHVSAFGPTRAATGGRVTLQSTSSVVQASAGAGPALSVRRANFSKGANGIAARHVAVRRVVSRGRKPAKTTCYYGSPSSLDRAVSCIPYIMPLIQSLHYGVYFIRDFPITLMFLKPLAPILTLYSTIPMFSLIVFFAIYFTMLNNPRASNFVRYNACQAILMDLLLAVVSMVEWVLRGPGLGGGGPAVGLKITAYNAIWVFVVGSFLYSVGCCVMGKRARIPYVADAAEAQTGRFA